MQFSTFTFRSAAMTVATFGLLAACDRNELPSAPKAPSVRASLLSLEVSDVSAASGDKVAIAIANPSAASIGAIQGYLYFNPSQLRYRGQVREAGSDEILVVNDKAAATGELRIAVIDPTSVTRTSPLVFDVIGANYAGSISFKVEEAVSSGSPIARISAPVAAGVVLNASLDARGDAEKLTVSQWSKIVDAGATVAAEPGEIRPGLKYGDTNFDNALSTNDGLYLINISLGINEMIIGTDGSGATGDRDAVMAGNVFPFNIDSTGGAPNAANLGEKADITPPGLETAGALAGQRVITVGDGLAIINESIFIDQPVVGSIMPGRPAAAANRIVFSGNVTTNTTWTAGNIYELQGNITITNGATLTIEPGTLVEGQRGTAPGVGGSALFVARDGRLVADGTPLQPIVFTCVAGPTARFKGCWGGLSILGNATTNDGTGFASPPAPPNPQGASPAIPGRSAAGCNQRAAEGGAGNYGGCNDDDNSGTLRYVRVEYAGFRFTPENELNGIALYGVGRGTIVDFVQVHAGLDDGIEFFGGTVNAKHLYLTANSDDSFDYTEGWNGNAQFIIVQHDSLDSDKGFEQDNFEGGQNNLPRATPRIYNATLVGKANVASTSGAANNNSVGAFNIRRGTWPKMANFYVQNFPFALDVDDDNTCTGFNTAAGFEFTNSIFTQNGRLDNSDSDPVGCGSEVAVVGAATGAAANQTPATSTLRSPLDVMVPDFRPANGTATGGVLPPTAPPGAPAGFFEQVNYIGAVAPANGTNNVIPWYAGWTRGWQSSSTP